MTVPFVVDTPVTRLTGDLTVPADATGIVVFAHGSGSSRHSPRNQAVARTLQDDRFATLLLDMLSEDEDRDPGRRFDVDLLRDRLVWTMDRLGEEAVGRLPLGLFGASTGAAAALAAAAARPSRVRAVVSRGGRPDLADAVLPQVTCPVLLLVGERDRDVVALNEQASAALPGTAELTIVPGATHLFEEPGALEAVAEAAAHWFDTHL